MIPDLHRKNFKPWLKDEEPIKAFLAGLCFVGFGAWLTVVMGFLSLFVR